MQIIIIIIVVLGIACMSISGMVTTLLGMKMIGEINKTRPFEQHIIIGKFRWPDEDMKILAEYRKLYPNGPLIRQIMIAAECGFSGVAMAAGFGVGATNGILEGIAAACFIFFPGSFIIWLKWESLIDKKQKS